VFAVKHDVSGPRRKVLTAAENIQVTTETEVGGKYTEVTQSIMSILACLIITIITTARRT